MLTPDCGQSPPGCREIKIAPDHRGVFPDLHTELKPLKSQTKLSLQFVHGQFLPITKLRKAKDGFHISSPKTFMRSGTLAVC